MKKKMTLFGISHSTVPATLVFMAITILLGLRYSDTFKFVGIQAEYLKLIGIVTFIIGMSLNLWAAIPLIKAYKEKKLITNGLYKIVKNPMYVTHVFFTIPGVALFLNNWLILTVTIFFFVLMKILIKREYEYLIDLFGDEYKAYEKSVLLKFL